MIVTLYSTNCPKCKVLETKLRQLGVEFTVVTDTDKVSAIGQENGIMSAPILQVDSECMDFTRAIKYLKEIVS